MRGTIAVAIIALILYAVSAEAGAVSLRFRSEQAPPPAPAAAAPQPADPSASPLLPNVPLSSINTDGNVLSPKPYITPVNDPTDVEQQRTNFNFGSGNEVLARTVKKDWIRVKTVKSLGSAPPALVPPVTDTTPGFIQESEAQAPAPAPIAPTALAPVKLAPNNNPNNAIFQSGARLVRPVETTTPNYLPSMNHPDDDTLIAGMHEVKAATYRKFIDPNANACTTNCGGQVLILQTNSA